MCKIIQDCLCTIICISCNFMCNFKYCSV